MILDWIPSVDAIFKIIIAPNYLHASFEIIFYNLYVSTRNMSYVIY